jgi:hypothetical protein
MIFQNVRGQAFDGIFHSGKLDQDVITVCIVFDHFMDAAQLPADPVQAMDDKLFFLVASFGLFIMTTIMLHILTSASIIYPVGVYRQWGGI